MSGLNCIVRVYITPDMPVMEVWYTVPCEAYFVSEQHAAAEEGFFTKLPKETLPKCLEWAKIKQSKVLYAFKVVQAQQLFMENTPHCRACHIFPTSCATNGVTWIPFYVPRRALLHINCL
jgi:hypothetical protein